METLTALCRKQCMHCHILTVCPLYPFFSILIHFVTEDYRKPCCLFSFFFFFKHAYCNTSYRKKDAITLVCETGI